MGLKRLHKVGMSKRVESSGDEDSLGEDASKRGDDAEMFDVNTLTSDEVFAEQEVTAKDMNLTIDKVYLASSLAALKNLVMSDSEESGITHTTVSSLYEDLSDIGSPRADDHELLEPPYMLEDPYAEAALQAPPSPDYVPGPEEPEQAPPSPDYVPGPELADDEIVAGDQPYAEDASPMAHSPDDVPESDPEADPEEDDDEDPEEDPIDYSAQRRSSKDNDKGSDQRSQSMNEQSTTTNSETKDHKHLNTTIAISLISRGSVTMNSLQWRWSSKALPKLKMSSEFLHVLKLVLQHDLICLYLYKNSLRKLSLFVYEPIYSRSSVLSTNLEIQDKALLSFSQNRRGDEASIKKTCELLITSQPLNSLLTLPTLEITVGYFEEEDGERIRFLGGNSSSGIKKYRGLNSSDGGNIGDRVKIAGGVIGSGDEIEFSEELKELLPNETGK
ncbi:hypothetical protein Tco_1005384 [Tanacetum coccineum]|uniref:Uncharacterized protein n=1 Tax=Tanacetum coccineum TaxID=301880 RepID=A0ABQ5FEJ6_9ASTR